MRRLNLITAKWWAIAGLGAAGLVLATVLLFRSSDSQLADHLYQQAISTADEPAALGAVEQLALLEDAALPALVNLLDHPSPAVTLAARGAIGDRLARWRLLDKADASPRAARLAALLAARPQTADPIAKRVAADFATTLLIWPIDSTTIDGAQFAADCELVLRASAGAEPPTSTALIASAPTPQIEADALGGLPDDMPHGDFPEAIVGPPALPQSVVDLRQPNDLTEPSPPVDAPVVTPPAPAAFAAPEEISPLETPSLPTEPPPPAPGDAQASFVEEEEPGGKPASYNDADALPQPLPATEEPTLEPAPSATGDYAELEDRFVIADLAYVANQQAAQAELESRGYHQLQLKLAQQMVAEDPQVRIDLAETLPKVRGVNARRWLLWLTHDTDSDVRATAAAILATGDDPTIVARFRQMLKEEPSPEVRRQLENWLHLRR